MQIRGTYNTLQSLAAGLGFTFHEYGHMGQYPLPALTREAGSARPRIHLSSGIHGDEPAGVLALLELYQSGFFDDRAAWSLCPVLNPTGLERGTRENEEGRDLNRDYRYPRSMEVQAHRSWLESRPPHDLALSLHEDWETTGFYLYEINTSSHPCIGPQILDDVSHVMPIESGSVLDNHQVTSKGYIHHPAESDEPENWPEAIFHVKHCPMLSCTFESPSTLPMEQRINVHVMAVKAAIDLFIALY